MKELVPFQFKDLARVRSMRDQTRRVTPVLFPLGWLLLTLWVLPFGARMAIAQVGAWTKAAVDSASSPEARVQQGMVYDEAQGVVLLHGGSYASRKLRDTWEWNGETWTKVSDRGPTLWAFGTAYDPVRKVMVLTGGLDAADNVNENTWEWDGTTWVNKGAVDETPGIAPVMAYDTERKTVIRHGGFLLVNDRPVPFGNTWEWDGEQWSPLPDGPSLGAHSMVYDSVRHKMVVFGGIDDNASTANHTWEFDGTAWTDVSDQGPSARQTPGLVFDSQRGVTVLFGGGLANLTGGGWQYQSFNDMWQWDGQEWTSISYEAGPSNQNIFLRMVYDSSRDQIVMFGGMANPDSRRPNDTWLFQFPSGMPGSVWLNY